MNEIDPQQLSERQSEKREDGGLLSFRQRLLFVMGFPGWAITGSIVSSIGIYFYLPPEGAGLQVLVSEEVFFGVPTAEVWPEAS